MTPHKYVTGQEETKQEEPLIPAGQEKFKDITHKVKRNRAKRSPSRETM